ncbi:MAG: hypothetical protein M1114_02685 [Candidatus Dependentiae bacterium]|nr:hypothetical protein [Candidatus Dependentiae bacterium]
MTNKFFIRILFVGITLLGSNIIAKARTSFSIPKASSVRVQTPKVAYKTTTKSYFSSPKPYVKKAPCAGLGKSSKANGLLKSKIVPAHTKRTSKGYTLVNSYARSK